MNYKIEIKIPEMDGKIKAFANIKLIINNIECFLITGIKVIDGKNGLFVTMPNRKIGEEYKDIAFPITKDFREELYNEILGEYDKTKQKAIEVEDDLPF